METRPILNRVVKVNDLVEEKINVDQPCIRPIKYCRLPTLFHCL